MKYFTYILHSQTLDCFYVGQTNDLDRRILEHLSGKGKFSSRAKDWELVFHKEFTSRSESMNLESKIKNRGAGRFLDDNNVAIDKHHESQT